jgi:hypothetical protein
LGARVPARRRRAYHRGRARAGGRAAARPGVLAEGDSHPCGPGRGIARRLRAAGKRPPESPRSVLGRASNAVARGPGR